MPVVVMRALVGFAHAHLQQRVRTIQSLVLRLLIRCEVMGYVKFAGVCVGERSSCN